MEGNHHSKPLHADEQLVAVLDEFRKRLGFTEVHLTGGEPSIHPEAEAIIRLAAEVGFAVKMTSNGQMPVDRYHAFARAGLQQVTVSMHTLDGAALAAIMNPVRSVQWGARAVQQQMSLLVEISGIIGRKVNTVVGTNIKPALSVAAFVFSQGIDWRIMNSLEEGDASVRAIQDICNTLGAQPLHLEIIQGSSSYSVVMQTPNLANFRVKLIRPFRMTSMCKGCPVDRAGGCTEYAYGPRVEATSGGIMIRSCLHRTGQPFVLPAVAYFSSSLCAELSTTIR
jgi:cyclic pyranopterin phosphate synthase